MRNAMIVLVMLLSHAYALENGLCRIPPMGWNHWSCLRGYVTIDIARATADSMESMGLKKAGYVYINNDAGDGQRTADFRSLAPEFHSRGYKYGYYGWTGSGTGRETTYATRWAGYGIDYIKYDYFNYTSSDPTFKAMRDALAATGRPILYSAHAQDHLVNAALTEVVNMWRTGPDIYIPWETPNVWNKIVYNMDLNNRYAAFARPGYYNDPDFLLVGLADSWTVPTERLTYEEEKSHFSLWCIMASPLIIGADIRTLTKQSLSILLNTEAIAVNQDSLGYQGRPVRKNAVDNTEVWVKNLKNGDRAVLLFNRSSTSRAITVRWSDAGMSGTVRVRDIWTRSDLGMMADSMSVPNIPAHGCAMYRLSGGSGVGVLFPVRDQRRAAHASAPYLVNPFTVPGHFYWLSAPGVDAQGRSRPYGDAVTADGVRRMTDAGGAARRH